MKNWISWERKELFKWNFRKKITNFWRAIICWSFKFTKLTHPSTFFRVLSISWSYRYTASTFLLLLKISVRLIMVSIILHSRQRDIPVFRYKLRMVPMWVKCNSSILEQLKNKITTYISIELWHFNFKRIKKEIFAICVWDEKVLN